MCVPVLFVLGQPIRLAGDLLAPLLRTRVVAVLTLPPLALALYAAVLVGTHLTGSSR